MTTADWNIYLPLLYATGTGLQLAYALPARRPPFALACLGAALCASAALYERDITVFVGQCVALFLLRAWRTA